MSASNRPQQDPSPESQPTAEDQRRRDLTLDDGSRSTSPTGAPVQTMTGSSLGPYELLEMLGQGGMGAVFKAKHTRLGKYVAIKVLPTQFTHSVEALARFDREMKAVGALEHPNIVRATDANEHLGTHYLVMEYVEGQDLQKFVKQHGPLEIGEACRLIRDAAHALQHAHEFNLIHRDIKPSNLLLTKTGQLKVLDLGLARLVGEGLAEEGLTTTGTSLGTPDYMAPEQWSDSHTVDFRTDLYALGCTLYFLLVGRPPFGTEQYRTVVGKLTAHTQAPIPPLRDVRPEVPPALDALYQRLLVKDATQRLGSASELIAAIEPFCTGPMNASVKMVAMVVPPAAAADGASKTASQTKPAISNGPGPAPAASGLPKVAVGIAALVAIAFIAVVLANIGQRPPTSDDNLAVNEAYPPDLPSTVVPAASWHGWPADAPPPAIAPFDVGQAKAHQEAWAKYLEVPVEYTNSIGMKFRLIPPGEFEMGGTEKETKAALDDLSRDNDLLGEDKEYWEPWVRSSASQHTVILTRAIYIGVHEVTQKQYDQAIGNNPSYYAPNGAGKDFVKGIDTTSHPVESVSWNGAADFCAKLGQLEHLTPFDWHAGQSLHGAGYRLPTEAEWEFAGRAGTTTAYWIGDHEQDLAQAGWFKKTFSYRTHAVGELRRNPFGLHDIHGNVWEWAMDGGDTGDYTKFRDLAAIDPGGSFSISATRLIRGGDVGSSALVCRMSNRGAFPPTTSVSIVGLRVALSVDAVKELLAREKDIASGKSWHGWPADAPPPAIAPFDAEQAKAHQKAWADYLKVPVEFENSLGMKFRLIPPGEFEMGTSEKQVQAWIELHAKSGGNKEVFTEYMMRESPRRHIVLTHPFYLGVHELTQGNYEAVIGLNPAYFSPSGEGKALVTNLRTSELPVESISWLDAIEFCLKLSQREHVSASYRRTGEGDQAVVERAEDLSYRLSTEAEWEFSCRAGTKGPWFFADEEANTEYGSYLDIKSPYVVGQHKPNPFGLFDVYGNVDEYCEDWFAAYEPSDVINPINLKPLSHPTKVRRGGASQQGHGAGRSAYRDNMPPEAHGASSGTRLALSVDAVKDLLAREKDTVSGKSWHGWPADAPPPAIAPFNAEQAKGHQEAWAKHLKVPVEYENSLGMKFRLIPPGEFEMGSTEQEAHEHIEAHAKIAGEGDKAEFIEMVKAACPQRHIVITKPFYLGAHEVTQGNYVTAMGSNPAFHSPMGEGKQLVSGIDCSNLPVESVSWHDFIDLCLKLSERERLAASYRHTGTKEQLNQAAEREAKVSYRLPTEAEWEFSCRAGTTTLWFFPDADLREYGAFENVKSSHAVGQHRSNPFGLFDVSGNVAEHCEDWFVPYDAKNLVDPHHHELLLEKYSRKAIRGGTSSSGQDACRSASRQGLYSWASGPYHGGRLALSVEAVQEMLMREKSATPIPEAR